MVGWCLTAASAQRGYLALLCEYALPTNGENAQKTY